MTSVPDAVSRGDAVPGGAAPIPLWRIGIVALLAGATLTACLLAPVATGHTQAGVTLTLPYRIGQWWGIDQSISEAEKTVLPTDTEFARKSYESGSGDNILCSIVLSGAEKRSIHRPEICLPGQGWTVRSSQVVPVTLQSGSVLRVMALSLVRPVQLADGRKTEVHGYYLYWFVGSHVVTPYHWERVWLTSWDRIVHRTNHRWAYVIVHSLITDNLRPGGKGEAQTMAMLKDFIVQVVPSFEIDEQDASLAAASIP